MTKDEATVRSAMKLALEALELCNGAQTAEGVVVYTGKEITALREALAEQPAQQEPVALKWQQSPIRTAWGDDMVVASVAIDKDHTLSLYCEREQTPKVEAMFTPPPAQRKPLTDEQMWKIWNEQGDDAMEQKAAIAFARAIEESHGIMEDA